MPAVSQPRERARPAVLVRSLSVFMSDAAMLSQAAIAIGKPIRKPLPGTLKPGSPRTKNEGQQPQQPLASRDDLLRERICDHQTARGDDHRHHAVDARHREPVSEDRKSTRLNS